MNQQKEIIHIALAFDQNFLTPFYVLLTSIFHNNKGEKFLFHTIATGVSNLEVQEITAFVEHNGSNIVFYKIDLNNLKGFVETENTHVSMATYYRLFFPDLVPQDVKMLLYLDTDVVVTGRLKELYHAPISPYIVGAVPDDQISSRPELDINEGDKYFNAGVLLIDLPKWRENKISEKAAELMHLHPEKIIWHDQDALNATLKKNWCELDIRFNLTYFNVPQDVNRKELGRFLKDKVVIHYTTQNKPWLLTCTNRVKFLYHDYFKVSPHKHKSRFMDEHLRRKNFFKLVRIKIKDLLTDHTPFYSLFKNPISSNVL